MTTQRPERRARIVALAGLSFQILLSAFFVVLWAMGKSEAVRALVLLTGLGTVIWLFLVLICHQRVLVQDETLETEHLRRERGGAGGTGAIFDMADERLLLARRRLEWMYKWMMPSFTVLLELLLLRVAVFGWAWPIGEPLSSAGWPVPARNSIPLLSGMTLGAALLSFWFSRYAVGLSRYREWQILHAGATWLMGVTLASVAVSGSLAAYYYAETPIPERVVAYVLRILLCVLGAEILLNLILDFYRPRAADETPRPAFDSRLLGLFTEPGGIARSIADAINYQFGFEVSSTWFYKLLQRSVVPLIGFAVATMFLFSSLVFVGANEVGVIELFGKKKREVGDGLSLKWPWPIEKVYKVATAQVHELKIGILQETEKPKANELFLWTNLHDWEPHLNVLVATPKLAKFLSEQGAVGTATRPSSDEVARRSEAVPVSQLRVSAAIQYRIRDAYDWLRRYGGPENEGPRSVLTAIAKREIMRQCASADVARLMGTGRGDIEQNLRTEIQKAADQQNLGVDILFLGLQGVHPPSETAEAFQDVIGAESKRTAAERSARADANRRLSEVAGDVTRAEQLAEAIRQINELESKPTADQDKLEAARNEVARLFFGSESEGVRPVGGEAAKKVAEARARRWRLENQAQGQATAFIQEMATKNAAPRVYRTRKYVEMLAEATQGIRKYILAASEADQSLRTFHLNLQDSRDIPINVAIEKKTD